MVSKALSVIDKLRAQFLNQCGLQHYEQWELETAISLFREANHLDETKAEYHLNLARAYARSSDYHQAIAALGDFANLIRSIAQSDGGAHFKDQRLYAEGITLIQKGQTTRLTREDLGSHLGTLPSRKDWLTIASEIEGGAATSGGWRGCFVSDGKAAFVADSSGNIGLTAFDFDRPWQSR